MDDSHAPVQLYSLPQSDTSAQKHKQHKQGDDPKGCSHQNYDNTRATASFPLISPPTVLTQPSEGSVSKPTEPLPAPAPRSVPAVGGGALRDMREEASHTQKQDNPLSSLRCADTLHTDGRSAHFQTAPAALLIPADEAEVSPLLPSPALPLESDPLLCGSG